MSKSRREKRENWAFIHSAKETPSNLLCFVFLLPFTNIFKSPQKISKVFQNIQVLVEAITQNRKIKTQQLLKIATFIWTKIHVHFLARKISISRDEILASIRFLRRESPGMIYVTSGFVLMFEKYSTMIQYASEVVLLKLLKSKLWIMVMHLA